MNAGLFGCSGGSGDRGACCGDEFEDERCAPALPVELVLCSGSVEDSTGTVEEDAAAAVAAAEEAAAGPSMSMLVGWELAAVAAAAVWPLVRVAAASCLSACECTCGEEDDAAALTAGGEMDADEAP